MELAHTEEGNAFETLQPSSVPAWRVMAGNCAAGATAGASVEAGGLLRALLHAVQLFCLRDACNSACSHKHSMPLNPPLVVESANARLCWLQRCSQAHPGLAVHGSSFVAQALRLTCKQQLASVPLKPLPLESVPLKSHPHSCASNPD